MREGEYDLTAASKVVAVAQDPGVGLRTKLADQQKVGIFNHDRLQVVAVPCKADRPPSRDDLLDLVAEFLEERLWNLLLIVDEQRSLNVELGVVDQGDPYDIQREDVASAHHEHPHDPGIDG